MQLYQISDDMLAVLSAPGVDLETGEIDWTAYEQRLAGVEADWNAKACAVAKYIAGLEADEAAKKEAAKRMNERAMQDAAHAKRLRDYLLRECERTGKKPADAEIQVAMRKSSAVEIRDDSALPPDFWRETVKRDPDKTLIKQAIKDGHEVPGAQLVERVSLQIK